MFKSNIVSIYYLLTSVATCKPEVGGPTFTVAATGTDVTIGPSLEGIERADVLSRFVPGGDAELAPVLPLGAGETVAVERDCVGGETIGEAVFCGEGVDCGADLGASVRVDPVGVCGVAACDGGAAFWLTNMTAFRN